MSTLDGDEIDASLIVMALHRYVDAVAPRMRSTVRRIRERLGQNGLLRRYPARQTDGLPGVEAAFGLCSFWSVHYRALVGELEEAAAEFEHLLTYANDVGLFAEEIDPGTGAALGNFPQAFTHVGLINAAVALASRSRGGERRCARAWRRVTWAGAHGGDHDRCRCRSRDTRPAPRPRRAHLCRQRRILGLRWHARPDDDTIGRARTATDADEPSAHARHDGHRQLGASEDRRFLIHVVDGWLISVVYALAFEAWDEATWWLGALIGVIHAAFLLAAVLPLLPAVHVRMASEYQSPSDTPLLEPPGFMALNYGRAAPVVILAAHVVYGIILGSFYQVTGR